LNQSCPDLKNCHCHWDIWQVSSKQMPAGAIDPLAEILRFDPKKRTLDMAACKAALTPHVAMPIAQLEGREYLFLRPQAPPFSQDLD